MLAPIQTGICSFGMSGRLFHAPFIESHPGFVLRAIVERHQNDSASIYPNAILCRTVEELIADPLIELVVVNTPVQLHYAHCVAALSAGKSVIVEKPFTVTAREASALMKLAQEKNCFFSVYQNRRYDGDFCFIRSFIQSGRLGALHDVEFRYDRFRPQLSGKAHKEGDQAGAGILHDLGAHLIDQALQLFGLPNSIEATLEALRPGTSANDHFELDLFYAGFRVRLGSNMLQEPDRFSYKLLGARGQLRVARSDRQEAALLAGTIPALHHWCPADPNPSAEFIDLDRSDIGIESFYLPSGNYMEYYSGILAAIRFGEANPVAPIESLRVMELIDAAFRSHSESLSIPADEIFRYSA